MLSPTHDKTGSRAKKLHALHSILHFVVVFEDSFKLKTLKKLEEIEVRLLKHVLSVSLNGQSKY